MEWVNPCFRVGSQPPLLPTGQREFSVNTLLLCYVVTSLSSLKRRKCKAVACIAVIQSLSLSFDHFLLGIICEPQVVDC